MREGSQPEARTGTDRESLKRSGSDLDKRYPVALVLYAALGVLVWFTMDAGKVMVMGKPVEMRWIPLIIIGGLALRTVLARSAERIRRGGEKDSL
jgi:Na+/H+ antiporter NhaC